MTLGLKQCLFAELHLIRFSEVCVASFLVNFQCANRAKGMKRYAINKKNILFNSKNDLHLSTLGRSQDKIGPLTLKT